MPLAALTRRSARSWGFRNELEALYVAVIATPDSFGGKQSHDEEEIASSLRSSQ